MVPCQTTFVAAKKPKSLFFVLLNKSQSGKLMISKTIFNFLIIELSSFPT